MLSAVSPARHGVHLRRLPACAGLMSRIVQTCTFTSPFCGLRYLLQRDAQAACPQLQRVPPWRERMTMALDFRM
jgi:hypothetical protein